VAAVAVVDTYEMEDISTTVAIESDMPALQNAIGMDNEPTPRM
jgi:hypothetical protein